MRAVVDLEDYQKAHDSPSLIITYLPLNDVGTSNDSVHFAVWCLLLSMYSWGNDVTFVDPVRLRLPELPPY